MGDPDCERGLTPAARGACGHTFALRALASQLPGAADGFGLLARSLFGGLLVVIAELHLPEDAFPLHLLLQGLQRLIDVVIADVNLHALSIGYGLFARFRMTQNAGRKAPGIQRLVPIFNRNAAICPWGLSQI